MVEEAYAYVQGENLKACAALLIEAYQLPDRQAGLMMFIQYRAERASAEYIRGGSYNGN